MRFAFYSYCYTREQKEYSVFQAILQAIPGLEVRLLNGSEEDIRYIADLVSVCDAVDDILVPK